MADVRFAPTCCSSSSQVCMHLGARHVVIEKHATRSFGRLRSNTWIDRRYDDAKRPIFVGSEPRISVGLPAQLASCRASSCSAAQHNAYASLDLDDEHAARRYTPIIVLWTSLAILLWCTQRASDKVQVAAFLVAEAAYIWLHVKPLTAILAAVPAQPDISFLRCYTTGTYFASELALFWMLAFASPIRAVVPRAVLAIHAAFHVLYTVLATFARRWCLQQNIDRLQASRSGTLCQSLWAATLNLLNGADAALHGWYFILLAAAF